MQKVFKILFVFSLIVLIGCVILGIILFTKNPGNKTNFLVVIIPIVICFGTMIFAATHLGKKK